MGMWNLNNAARTALLAAFAVAALALTAWSAPSASAHHLCPNTGSPNGPFDIQTYEAADYRNLYARTLELAGGNKLFPEMPGFSLPRMETGDRATGSGQTADPDIPPVLLKAMAYLESGWAQASFSPLVDYGETGPVLSSHDCGYGIMQVTSGMQNISGVPSLEQAMIGSHYAFNIAKGARILADKWNMAPELRPVIGTRDPAIIENWYYSIWGYNGWAFQNHPLNPSYNTTRAPYSCGPATDGLGHDRSQYPYQEIVLGCVANPPSRLGATLWPPQEVHLPELTDPKFAEPMKVDNWNPCTYSGQCTAMDIPTPNTSHTDPTAVTLTREQIIGVPALAVSTNNVSLTVQPLATSAGTAVSVTNSGTGVLGYRATSNVPWLKVSPSAGVALGADLGAKPGSVSLSVNAANLAPGTYTAQVKVESLYAIGATGQTINVTVETALPSGIVARGSGSTVYLIVGAVRRQFPNPATFEAMGYRWEDVQVVANSRLALHVPGNPVLDATQGGRMIKGPGDAVYVTEGGFKRHIAGPSVVDQCGYSFGAVVTLSADVMATIPDGNDLASTPCPRFSPPDGTLLKGSGPAVYVIKSAITRWVPNIATFEANGLRLENVDTIADAELALLGSGRAIRNVAADGNLIAAELNGAIYVMEGGKARHILGPGVLTDCGYGFDAVNYVSAVTLAATSRGGDLYGPPCPKLSLPTGTLLLAGDGAVYVVDSSKQRRHIVSADAFTSCGYLWGNIDPAPPSIVSAVPETVPLGGAPCP